MRRAVLLMLLAVLSLPSYGGQDPAVTGATATAQRTATLAASVEDKRPRDIELWTLQVIDRLKGGQPIEDSRVELKSEWVDARQAARRIAAHANAARGEPILWIIGLDEASHTVVGARVTELANWFAQVTSYFDEFAPELTDIAVPIDGTTVVALRFTTDRAPYVIKHQDARLTLKVAIMSRARLLTAS